METTMSQRYGVSLPDWYHRKLLLWAKLKGTNRATLSANIIQNRIEENWSWIDKEIDAIAKFKGISREQLEADWLNGGGESDED